MRTHLYGYTTETWSTSFKGQAKSAIVTRVTSDISVDGVLDEEAWQLAPKIGALTQREPRTGGPPSEQTDVTLLYDDDSLYIGVMAYDSEPQRVIGTQMARDASLGADDRISIVLDTYRDQRNAFHFATNPAGALGFVSRRNVELLRASTKINPRPKDFLNIQQMFHGIYYTRFTRLDTKEVESWKLDITAPIDWHFKSGDAVHSIFWPSLTYERLFAPFQISPGVVLPPGEYRFTRWKNHVSPLRSVRSERGV